MISWPLEKNTVLALDTSHFDKPTLTREETREGPYCVRALSDGSHDQKRWNDFLERNHESNFYQQYQWKTVNEQEFGHQAFYLAAEDAQGVAGVFPMVFIQSRLFGRILCSMPFVNFGGLAVDNAEAESALIKHAAHIAEQKRADYLEIRSLRPCSQTLPTSTHKISMSLRLDPNPDLLWNAFKSKHRTAIRRAYKEGLTVASGTGEDLLDTFFDIMTHSWRALGTPIYRKRYFRRIVDTFGDQVRIFVVYKGETPVATAFNGHFKQTVEGMWAGGIPAHRSLQANYVLYWEMIKDACERGFQHYNLGRSTEGSGAEEFKKKWNANPSQLYWQYQLTGVDSMPNLNTTNPKYGAAIETWKRLPLWLTRVVGPTLSKDIP